MERAKQFMDAVWEARNHQGADTESKLVAAILRLASDAVINYNAQNSLVVLDKNDLIALADEIEHEI